MMNSKKLIYLVAQKFPKAVFLKETTHKILALTIDDVPARDDESGISTQRILEVIDNYNQSFSTNFKVTFFITTNHLSDGTKILEEITEKGHEIGNHGTTDHRHASLPKDKFEAEFNQAHQVLSRKISQPIRWFRPGQAFYNQDMVNTLNKMDRQLGYQDKFALASMIPFDTTKFLDDPKFTLKNINLFTFPGSILLLHGGFKTQANNTVKVLHKILPSLHQQGYNLVTLSKLFKLI